MKVDLLTIFPGILIDNSIKKFGEIPSRPDFQDDIIFINSHVITYKKLLSNPNTFPARYFTYITSIADKIIDSENNKIDDFTIIFDKGVDYENLILPNPDFHQLLSYFSYRQLLDHSTFLDFIKIICFDQRGREIFFNNNRAQYSPRNIYMLPMLQKHRSILKLHSNAILLINTISKTHKSNINLYKRVINAITLFNDSCRINPYNPSSSIIIIVSAFESLLSLPIYSKVDNFAYAFKAIFGFDEDIEKWAKDLYTLRSTIVHGDVTTNDNLMISQDKHYPYYKVTRNIFNDCLLLIMQGYGLIDIDMIYKFDVIKKFKNKIKSNISKIKELLKQNKKYTYSAFKKKKDLYLEFLNNIQRLTPTDYSASSHIIKTIKLVISIAKPWIEDNKIEINKILIDEKTNPDAIPYLKSQLTSYDNILTSFSKLELLNTMSLKSKFEIIDELDNIREAIGYISYTTSGKENIEFNIHEYLEICINSLDATYWYKYYY